MYKFNVSFIVRLLLPLVQAWQKCAIREKKRGKIKLWQKGRADRAGKVEGK